MALWIMLKSFKMGSHRILLFIFFYFMYPVVADYLSKFFGMDSYLYILFYTIFISYVFLVFSGNHKTFLGGIKKFDLFLFLAILLLGIFFGFLFFLIKEPVPTFIIDLFSSGDLIGLLNFLFFSSFMIAIAEQMIFSGFLFNSYKNLTSKYDAYFQTSIIFVMFHLLRFQILVEHYYVYFSDWYLLFIVLYYVFLFLFMTTALHLYSFNGKKYSGNFFYAVALHFAADFGLFLFYSLQVSIV